ncbi:MAG: methyltransferase domain-containing protein [Deltaproteobacteria bacterium]|nr:methyltransferase domain-containing protein [Deltaproteobacteria bacterium]
MEIKQGIRRNFARRAASYDRHAAVQRFMAQELLRRAGGAAARAARILEIGCGTGYLTEQLRRANDQALVVALDLDPALVQRARARMAQDPGVAWVVADAETWGGRGVFDLVIANASFQWLTRPEAALRACFRSLKPGGRLAFSSLGPRTFQELGASLKAAANYLGLAAAPLIPAQNFLDAEAWQRLLRQAGFVQVDIFREERAVKFPSVIQFLKDLQATGATNPRPRPFSSRLLRGFTEIYRSMHGNNGSIPATYEIIWAMARKEVSGFRYQVSGNENVPEKYL